MPTRLHLIACSFLFLALCCWIDVRAQSVDVSSERVSYDNQFLQVLAGDAPIGSVAVWPQSMYTVRNQASDTLNAFGRYVADYYGPTVLGSTPQRELEVGVTDTRFRGMVLNDGLVRLQGDLGVMARLGTYSGDSAQGSFLLARPSIRFMGSVDEHLGYFLDLSNGVRLFGNARWIADTDPSLGRTLKFVFEDSAFFDRYIGYVQYQSEWLRVRFGREALQFGVSPIDNFVHSIDAPLLDGLLIDVPYKSFRFTMTHSGANGVDPNGLPVPSKFVATHRLSFDPAPWLSVALSDMIVYANRGVDFAYLNPLAFFVSAGLGTRDRSENDNSLLGVDVAVRPWNGALLYGSLMADDINFGTLGDTSFLGNTNKYAYQVGLSYLLPFNQQYKSGTATVVTAEYARIDPFTFSHRRNWANYTTLGAPLGYNMQSNSDRLALQLRHWFTPRTFIRIDVDFTRHGENILDSLGNVLVGPNPRFPGALSPIGNVGGDILRGDADDLVGNRFLRGNVSYQRRIQVWMSTEWLPNVFTDVRIGYTNRNGGNTPGDFLFGTLELRFGY